MIVIDGRECEISLSNYSNLEEVLINLTKKEALEQRIVTDVFVNDELFSELYPHQAEDIDVEDIQKLELRTMSVETMAGEIVVELPKVINIMASGSRQVAVLLRQAEIAEALEMLQDMIAVSRDFLNMIHVLRSQFSSGTSVELEQLGDTIGDLLGEISDVMENEDWILVADLLEFEYLPACEGWRGIIQTLDSEVTAAQGR